MSFEDVSIIYDIPRKDYTKFNRLINHLPEKWITNFSEVSHDIYGEILQDILRSKKVSRYFYLTMVKKESTSIVEEKWECDVGSKSYDWEEIHLSGGSRGGGV